MKHWYSLLLGSMMLCAPGVQAGEMLLSDSMISLSSEEKVVVIVCVSVSIVYCAYRYHRIASEQSTRGNDALVSEQKAENISD